MTERARLQIESSRGVLDDARRQRAHLSRVAADSRLRREHYRSLLRRAGLVRD